MMILNPAASIHPATRLAKPVRARSAVGAQSSDSDTASGAGAEPRRRHRVGAGPCRWLRAISVALATLVAQEFMAPLAHGAGGVPIRLNIQWIVDANGNRPLGASNKLREDEQIEAEVDAGNEILRSTGSEFELQMVGGGVRELTTAPGWSRAHMRLGICTAPVAGAVCDSDAVCDSSTDSGDGVCDQSAGAALNALLAAATADPASFNWDANAINIYVTAGQGSGVTYRPPNNRMILMNQDCGNAPSCILHEIGHNLNLYHTFEPNDGCADTISDFGCCGSSCSAPAASNGNACQYHYDCDSSPRAGDGVCQFTSTCDEDSDCNNPGASVCNFLDVTRDMLAATPQTCTPGGSEYNDATAATRAQVDFVFRNVMSYHTGPEHIPQNQLSPCQLDRATIQGYLNRNWMVARQTEYVGDTAGRTCTNCFRDGQAGQPFVTLQDAFDDVSATFNPVNLSGRVLVLESSANLTLDAATSTLGDAADFPSGVPRRMTLTSRSGPATIRRADQGAKLFRNEIKLPDSEEFRTVSRTLEDLDTQARRAKKAAKEKAQRALDPEERAEIEAEGRKEQAQYTEEAIKLLKRIEKMAEGDHKLSVQLDIGDRYRFAKDCEYARRYYGYVKDEATDPRVGAYAGYRADSCEE